MQRLGYQRWVAQGGDWEPAQPLLAQIMPPGLVGIHLSWQFVFLSRSRATQLRGKEERSRARNSSSGRKWIFSTTVHTPANRRLWPCGFASWSGALDLRKIPGVDGQQRRAGRRAFDGSNVGQHFDLLVYQLRRFFGPHLLGESRRFLLWRKGHSSRCGQRISARNIPRT